MSRLLLILLWIILPLATANAATFSIILAPYHGPEMGLLVRGAIVAGDGERFQKVIAEAANRHPDHRMRIIGLDSPGGMISEALVIAKNIHSHGFSTIVPENAMCVSACVLAFTGGNQKTFAKNAHIGVHGASQEGGEQDIGALAATTGMAKVYAALGVPDTVIARMVITDPQSIYWLTHNDLMLFPNASEFEGAENDFAEIGAGYDGVTRPPHPTIHSAQFYNEGYDYGYKNFGGCENLAITLQVGVEEWGDVTNGCEAGLDALRKEHQTVVPLIPRDQTVTFDKTPTHSPALIHEASLFLEAFSEGYWHSDSADCSKYKNLSDVCQAAVQRKKQANIGEASPLTEAQINHEYGPQEWLDSYDWEYAHHEIWCGTIRAPSTLGCLAAMRDWPRKERHAP